MILLLKIACIVLVLQSFAFLFSLWWGYQRTIAVSRSLIAAIAAFYMTWPLLNGLWQFSPLLLIVSPAIIITFLIIVWAVFPNPSPAAVIPPSRRPLRIYLQHFLWPGLLTIALLSTLLTTVLKSQIPNLYFMGAGVTVYLLGFTLTFFSNRPRLPFFPSKHLALRPLGQVAIWFGIWLIALPTPYWYLTAIAPLTALFLVYKSKP